MGGLETRAGGASARSNDNQPDGLSVGSRVIRSGTCPVPKQNLGQHSTSCSGAVITRISQFKWTIEFWLRRTASGIWKGCLDFGHGDLVLFDLLIKRASRDAETFCRLLNPAAFFLKNAFDVLLFDFLKSQPRVEEG